MITRERFLGWAELELELGLSTASPHAVCNSLAWTEVVLGYLASRLFEFVTVDRVHQPCQTIGEFQRTVQHSKAETTFFRERLMDILRVSNDKV